MQARASPQIDLIPSWDSPPGALSLLRHVLLQHIYRNSSRHKLRPAKSKILGVILGQAQGRARLGIWLDHGCNL